MRRLYREYFGSEPPNLRVPTSGGRVPTSGQLLVVVAAFPGKNGKPSGAIFFVEDEALKTIFTTTSTTDHDGCLVFDKYK